MVHVLEDVHEQRRRAIVARRAERLHDRFARTRRCRSPAPARACGSRGRCRSSGSPAPPRAGPWARRRRAVRSGRAAPRCRRTHAAGRSPCVGPPDSREVFSCSTSPAPYGAEAEEDLGQPFARPGALLDRPGPRPVALDHRRPASRQMLFTCSNCASSTVARCPTTCRIVACRDQAIDGRGRDRPGAGVGPSPRTRPEAAAQVTSAESKSPTRNRSSSSDTTGSISDSHVDRVLLDAEQVEHRVRSRLPQFGGRDGAEPGREPLRRVVLKLLDVPPPACARR